MNLTINIASGVALYEQIAEQIKQLIVSGELGEGHPLPSVRMLAQELGVSVITTRRAYTELEQEGYVVTAPAKGTFVSSRYNERLRELGLLKLSELIDDLIYLAKAMDINQNEILELVHEHFDYVSNNPANAQANAKAKLTKFLHQRNLLS